MSVLTRKQRQVIERALYDLNRATKYIHDDRTVVCLKSSYPSTTLHYTRGDNTSLYPVAKDIGSDLVGLDAGIMGLAQLLTHDDQTRLNKAHKGPEVGQ